jgi:hypothetical protein
VIVNGQLYPGNIHGSISPRYKYSNWQWSKLKKIESKAIIRGGQVLITRLLDNDKVQSSLLDRPNLESKVQSIVLIIVVVLGVICMAVSGIAGIIVPLHMVDKVNAALPSERRFSMIGWEWFKSQKLLKEY